MPKKVATVEGGKSKNELVFDRKSRSEGRKGGTRAAKKNGAGARHSRQQPCPQPPTHACFSPRVDESV